MLMKKAEKQTSYGLESDDKIRGIMVIGDDSHILFKSLNLTYFAAIRKVVNFWVPRQVPRIQKSRGLLSTLGRSVQMTKVLCKILSLLSIALT